MESVAAATFRSVLSRVQTAAERSGRSSEHVRVVAASKTKPFSVIRQVYEAGHRVFGENYVQELVEKSSQLPDDIQWHFIGNLQSNKVKSLLGGVPNLDMVETVDDEKIANLLNRAVASLGRKPLKVLIQVNTSGEDSKHGVEPSGCVHLAKHVKLGCPNLLFSGLMTIGMLDYSSTPENFKTLRKCRTEVCEALGLSEEQCELSMGMSTDFENASSSCAAARLNGFRRYIASQRVLSETREAGATTRRSGRQPKTWVLQRVAAASNPRRGRYGAPQRQTTRDVGAITHRNARRISVAVQVPP